MRKLDAEGVKAALTKTGASEWYARAFLDLFSGMGPVYVLSGLIAWNFFAQSTNAATLHLVWGGSLLKKIYIPRTSFAISATGTGLINLLLSLVPLLIVMVIIQVPIRWTMIFLPIPILFLAMFTLGIGLIVSTMAIYYADIAEMFQITLTAWFYLTPIIWSPEILPELYGLWITRLNPMFYHRFVIICHHQEK